MPQAVLNLQAVAHTTKVVSAIQAPGDLTETLNFGTHRKLVTIAAHSESKCAPVAQRLEQQTHNLLVRGSNPCGGTNQLARVLTFMSRELEGESLHALL